MTGGTEFQEGAEAPQETREVTEVKEQLDRAAFEPEAAVEKTGDFKEAEAVETAFVDSVQLVQQVQVADSGRESSLSTDTATSKGIDAASREADETEEAASAEGGDVDEGGGDEGSEESEYPLPEPEQRAHASEENKDDLDDVEIPPEGGEEIPLPEEHGPEQDTTEIPDYSDGGFSEEFIDDVEIPPEGGEEIPLPEEHGPEQDTTEIPDYSDGGLSGGDTDGEDLGEESGIDGEGEEGAVDVEITDDATPEGGDGGGDEGSEGWEDPLEPEEKP